MTRLKCSMMGTAAVLFCLGVPRHAEAAVLDGQPVTVTFLYPNVSTVFAGPYNTDGGSVLTALPGPGNDFFNLDLNDTSIVAQYVASSQYYAAPFNGIDIYAPTVDFTSVSVDPSTNMVGFGPADVTFTTHDIYMNFQGLGFNSSTIAAVDINPVPEPAGLLLLAIGGISLVRRRRGGSR